jgi:hypothetical protein
LDVNNILSQEKRLDKEDQFTLLQRTVFLLKRTEGTKNTSMRRTALSGLGREIWGSSDDIDNYIDEERQW